MKVSAPIITSSIPTRPKDGYFLHALHVSAKNIIYLHKAR